MAKTEKTKEIHEAYENCKKVFEPSFALSEEVNNISDIEEKNFYILLHDFFLQQKQKESINKGVY